MDDPQAAAWLALKSVVDPELGLDLVTLGLIYGVEATQDELIVRMTLTSRNCPLGETLTLMAREALEGVCGRRAVRLEPAWDPPWTPERISPEGRRALRLP